jgi:hypothetical protein
MSWMGGDAGEDFGGQACGSRPFILAVYADCRTMPNGFGKNPSLRALAADRAVVYAAFGNVYRWDGPFPPPKLRCARSR